jgi:VanZ family protein
LRRYSRGEIALRYIILAAVCVIIFLFSANNGDDSSAQSGFIVDGICKIFFTDMNTLEAARQLAIGDILSVCVRKAAHFSEYAVLGVAAYTAFCFPKRRWVRFLWGLGFTFFYACTDEFHQLFVPDRAGSFRDVLIDTSGGLVGVVLALAVSVVLEARRIIRQAENKGE